MNDLVLKAHRNMPVHLQKPVNKWAVPSNPTNGIMVRTGFPEKMQ